MARPRVPGAGSWVAFLGLVLAVTWVACESGESKRWDHGRLEDGSAAGLFTIELPAGAKIDTRFGSRIDWYRGDSNGTGGWVGPDWWIRWSWWHDGRTANSEYRSGDFPTQRRLYSAWETCALLHRAQADSTRDSSLFVIRGRCYRWRRQLLTVVIFQREPSYSLGAERVLASVSFQPTQGWR